MGKGTYRGGSTLISRSGWPLGYEKRPKDAPSAYLQEPAPVRKGRRTVAKVVRSDREAVSMKRTLRAVELLRSEGLSDADIRRRLKLKRLPSLV
jgi:hypothetical protein